MKFSTGNHTAHIRNSYNSWWKFTYYTTESQESKNDAKIEVVKHESVVAFAVPEVIEEKAAEESTEKAEEKNTSDDNGGPPQKKVFSIPSLKTIASGQGNNTRFPTTGDGDEFCEKVTIGSDYCR